MRVDGVKQLVPFYNLDVIISVGYRVKSKNGVIFRQWANKILKDYMLKGYAVNQKRLEYLEKTIKLIDIANRIDERHGECYEIAHEISLNLGISNNIVTGYIYGYTDKSKFLHSWVETTIKGEEYVIDGTLNSLINKQGYYLMQHAKPITKISNQTFANDNIKNYLEKIKTFPIGVYYVFRDEIIKDFKKMMKYLKDKKYYLTNSKLKVS